VSPLRTIAPGLILVAALFVAGPDAESRDGRRIYEYLSAQGALTSYMVDLVSTVGRDLTDGSSCVNVPYRAVASTCTS
jgi:hypothetical protein